MSTNGYMTVPVLNRLWFDTQCKSSVNNYYTSLNIHCDKKGKFSLTFSSKTHVTIINLTRVVT